MIGIGSFNPISTVATVAFGPLGGIAAQLATRLASAIGQEVLQQLGDKMGLPQGTIDLAQGAFAGAVGDQEGVRQNLSEAVSAFGENAGASPFQQAQAETQLRDVIDEVTTNMAQSQEARDARASGGRSWLMSLAEGLGKIADKLAGEMEQMSGTLGEGSNKSSQNLKFAAKSQEFSQFFSSANTVLKTLGEALTQGARKQ